MRTALVGCGRWGTKLLAAVLRHEGFEVVAVVDRDAGARARARAMAPRSVIAASLEDALELRPEAVLIATPSQHHAEHGLRAIEAGADVFVEKPLALRSSDARQLHAAARAHRRVGMVGHVLRYHPAVERLIALVGEGFVGAPGVVTGTRFTQSGSPAPLWTLGPHDLCTLHALDGSPVTQVLARSLSVAARLGAGVAGGPVGVAGTSGAADAASGSVRTGAVTASPAAAPAGVLLQISLQSGLVAVLRLSTTAPAPARELRVYGHRRIVGVNELEGGGGALGFSEAAAAGARIDVSRGWFVDAPPLPETIDLDAAEPLQRELSHFAERVRDRVEPRTSFGQSLWVVEVLERAEAILQSEEARPLAPPFTSRASAP